MSEIVNTLTANAATAADRLSLADPAAQLNDARALWARLRASSPVHRNERPDGEPFWAVLTYAESTAMLKDTETFRSNGGMRLDADQAAVTAASRGRMLIVTDPPDHGKIRRILGPAFTPKMTHRLERNMEETAKALIQQAIDMEKCDFSSIVAPLPASVICDMLGVPPEDRDFMVEQTMIAWGTTSADDAEHAERRRAHAEIMVYFGDLIARRRHDPQDDIVTALVNGEADGVPLSEEEIILNCDGIISGGNETTRHAAVGGVLALAENPVQWARLQADKSLVPTAAQEVLRYTSPVMHVVRTAVRDAVIAGQQITIGEKLAAWIPSANRDEKAFSDPESFDIGRTPNRHLTFSHGTHHCLGGALAVTELETLLRALTQLVQSIELEGPPHRLTSNLVWGFHSLPVRLTPSAGASKQLLAEI
jgi:cytochrome P450